MRICRFTVISALSFLLLGCVAPSKYSWGNYDGTLYSYYKDPTRVDAHMAEIDNIIRSAEKTNGKVAPGIHAEYGYLLMQGGKPAEAASQFEIEKKKWPESSKLMDSMIKIASAQSVKPLAAKE